MFEPPHRAPKRPLRPTRPTTLPAHRHSPGQTQKARRRRLDAARNRLTLAMHPAPHEPHHPSKSRSAQPERGDCTDLATKSRNPPARWVVPGEGPRRRCWQTAIHRASSACPRRAALSERRVASSACRRPLPCASPRPWPDFARRRWAWRQSGAAGARRRVLSCPRTGCWRR